MKYERHAYLYIQCLNFAYLTLNEKHLLKDIARFKVLFFWKQSSDNELAWFCIINERKEMKMKFSEMTLNISSIYHQRKKNSKSFPLLAQIRKQKMLFVVFQFLSISAILEKWNNKKRFRD